nr:phosphoribosylamine--glycine ligase [Clostridia bacterium]
MTDKIYKDGSPILVVGGGGREHAIVKKLSESPRAGKLYAAPGNAGIAQLAECLPIKATELDKLVAAAKEIGAGLVFVAPDDPLTLGLVDMLEAEGILAFGPKKNAAILEGSKVFSKGMMKKYGIPTAAYEVFSKPADALEYIKNENKYPTVIKADGLALGKGAIIAADYKEAEEAVKSIMEDKIFGASGNNVVVEEFLTGPEVTVLSFVDGKTVSQMVSSQDHKRVYDDDKGPNTGGMGAFAPSPLYTPELAARCEKEIFTPTVEAMNSEGRTFKGVIYFQLMITKEGPKVIEYNARFGDPETQAVLPLLDSDLIDIIDAVNNQSLDKLEIKWKNEAACCVVLASGGYPVKYETGFEITGLDSFKPEENITVYHAGTKLSDGKCVTGGGRVLGVTATADTLGNAIDNAYKAVGKISFEGMHYRNDIGRKKY